MHIRTSNQAALKLGVGNCTCNWGVHFAGLYETAAEGEEILYGFLNQGDRDGDFQLLAGMPEATDQFHEGYSRRYPDCAGHTADPTRFDVCSAEDLYYPDGVFSPWAMDRGLNEFYDESQKNGPRNIRATAVMEWALRAVPGVEHLMAYEARLNLFIPTKPWISICLYDVSRFSGKTIMQVLQTHPYTINGGVITENPYYQDPARWLEANAPEFLPGQEPAAHRV